MNLNDLVAAITVEHLDEVAEGAPLGKCFVALPAENIGQEAISHLLMEKKSFELQLQFMIQV